MSMEWLKGGLKEKEEKKEDEIELKPEEVKAQLEKVGKLETDFNSFATETRASMGRLNDFLNKQTEDDNKKRSIELAKKGTEEAATLDELWLTNPGEAAKRQMAADMQPLVMSQINMTSQQLRRQIFLEDDPTSFEYYHGDLKKEIDAMIDSQPANMRADAGVIKNAYYVAVGRKQKEINEGKVKSRFSGVSSNGNSSGATPPNGEVVFQLSDDEKKAARMFGASDEEYLKNKKELGYV